MFIRCVSDSVVYSYAFVIINIWSLKLVILCSGSVVQKVVSLLFLMLCQPIWSLYVEDLCLECDVSLVFFLLCKRCISGCVFARAYVGYHCCLYVCSRILVIETLYLDLFLYDVVYMALLQVVRVEFCIV
ncbi:hypothetical protein Hanom_Chr13g01230601 [Helianthus anomalus]